MLCATVSTERDGLVAEVKRMSHTEACAEGGQAGGVAAAWAGGQLWDDALRLTERLAEVASVNAAILSENSDLTQQVEVRLLCPESHAETHALAGACWFQPADSLLMRACLYGGYSTGNDAVLLPCAFNVLAS